MKIELYSRFSITKLKRQWFWRIRASNGEILASGEGYANKVDAIMTINLLKKELPDAPLVTVIQRE